MTINSIPLSGTLAMTSMMTIILMSRPTIETPSRMPDARETKPPMARIV
jgi:hypothetical protein